ncbi:MAG: RsfS/YbeB/iojap family protein [Lachnospiraceae bacterium]
MAKRGECKLRTEGYQDGKWIVLDYGDILVHIFGKDERKYYNIERLWRIR